MRIKEYFDQEQLEEIFSNRGDFPKADGMKEVLPDGGCKRGRVTRGAVTNSDTMELRWSVLGWKRMFLDSEGKPSYV